MTEDRKPETPGMSEVSAKVEHEAEDPVIALKREWDARWDRYASETDESDEVQMAVALDETAYEIFQTPATTPAGVAVKLVIWARYEIDGGIASGTGWSRIPVSNYPYDLDHLPVVSALHDLERMSQGIAPSTIKEPAIDEPLLALERRWREAIKASEEQPISDAQEEIAVTPARTIAGVLVKHRSMPISTAGRLITRSPAPWCQSTNCRLMTLNSMKHSS